MMTILGAGSILVGGLTTLGMSAFCLAGLANTKPGEGRAMWALIWTIVAAGITCAGAAGWLLWKGRPGWCILVGLAPIAIDVALFLLAVLLGI
jgi:hypothetical protein